MKGLGEPFDFGSKASFHAESKDLAVIERDSKHFAFVDAELITKEIVRDRLCGCFGRET